MPAIFAENLHTMQRKPFNLEAAMQGAPVVTRDGQSVKIAGYNPDAKPGNEVLCWIDGHCWAHHPNGLFVESREGSRDLFIAPTERTEWVVRVICGDGKLKFLGPYKSEEQAKKLIEHIENPATIHAITVTE